MINKSHLFFLFLFSFHFSSAQIPIDPDFYMSDCVDSLPGYYILTENEREGAAMILNHCGDIILMFDDKGLHGNFTLQPDGHITYADLKQFYLVDSTFSVVDSISCKDVFETNKHDFQILPNGHFLMLGSDTLRMDMTGFVFNNGKPGTTNMLVKASVVQEFDAHKNLVFEWHAKDYLHFSDADNYFVEPDSKWTDWIHINSAEMDWDGNIIISVRNSNEIIKINRKTGKIMWRLGGNKNQFKFVNCPVPFYGQHDVRRICNGNITFLDNGANKVSHGVRAMEFKLDEKRKIATLVWSCSYDSVKVSVGAGNVQRLFNGCTLIDWGRLTDATCFSVMNSSCNEVVRLEGIHSYRVKYVDKLPWKIHRPEIICFDSLGAKYLTTTQSYPSYLWKDSSTTRTIRVTDPVSYYVYVPYGNDGWFIRSNDLIVTALEGVCSNTIIKEQVKENSSQQQVVTNQNNIRPGKMGKHSPSSKKMACIKKNKKVGNQNLKQIKRV